MGKELESHKITVNIPSGAQVLKGDLSLPDGSKGIVLFAHGSGSSRLSPRNRLVARTLQEAGLATLLTDLLTETEEAIDAHTHHLRFDIPLLARRLVDITDWVLETLDSSAIFKIGYFGASTGAAAALVAAAERREKIKALVSRGGRPDLAGLSLPLVKAATLLMVGEKDYGVIELNESAYEQLRCPKELKIIPKATHLFEEPGALEVVEELAKQWFLKYLS